jgi:phosphoribosylformylglycinamidine synthase
MVGLLDNVSQKMTMHFKHAGDIIVLIGESRNDINSSEYLHKIHGVEFSQAPYFDLEEEYALQQTLMNIIKEKLILSAHDVSEGGLFVTLCESGFWNSLGFDIKTDDELRKDSFLFGEGQSRVVVSLASVNLSKLKSKLAATGIPYTVLGTVTPGNVNIDSESWGNINDWQDQYDTAIENLLKGHESEHALSAL